MALQTRLLVLKFTEYVPDGPPAEVRGPAFPTPSPCPGSARQFTFIPVIVSRTWGSPLD